MEQSLKERLVGAAVLVVLAVIFVPMVLDGPEAPPTPAPATVAAVPSGEGTFSFDLNAPLPAAASATVAAPASAAAPTTVGAIAPAPATKATTSVATATTPSTAVAPPATTTKPAPAPAPVGGWAAQVASLSSQDKADGVAADLKAKGFKAFVVAYKDGKRTLYRVRVGPVASRDAADALAKRITAKTGQAARPVQHP